MATLSSTGRFAAGEACADNDILYGPYATIAAAHAALLNAEQNVVGRTVGIQTGNTIEEYWYQGGTDQANLVKKQSSEVEANPTGEATTPLNKIKIGETNYNIPQTDTSNLATKTELQQGLSGKQDTISDLSTIRSGAAAGATAVQPAALNDYVPKSATTGLLKNDGTVDTQTAGKAASALQPISGAQENNFASFDSNGGLLDSGCNEDSFATASQGAKADTAVQQVAVDPDTVTGNAGTNASVTNIGTQTAPVFKFTIPRGKDAYNPFKGTYLITDILPTTGQAGDYIYVVDSQNPPTTHVYTWNGTAFQDSGETVTIGDSQFANSTKPISQTNVVNDLITGGTTDVLSAEQGKVIGEELYGEEGYADVELTFLTKSYYLYNTNGIKVDSQVLTSATCARIQVQPGDKFKIFGADSQIPETVTRLWCFSDGTVVTVDGVDYYTVLSVANDMIDTRTDGAEIVAPAGSAYLTICFIGYDSSTDKLQKWQKISNGVVVDLSNLSDRVSQLEDEQVDVVDNLESDSTTDALSANQGRIIGKELYGEESYVDVELELTQDSYYDCMRGSYPNYTVDSSPSSYPSSGMYCTQLEIQEGDKFKIYGKGNTYSTALYAFADVDNNLVEKSAFNVDYRTDGFEFTAPENAVRLVVNFKEYDNTTDGLQKWQKVDNGLVGDVANLKGRVEELEATIVTPPKSVIDGKNILVFGDSLVEFAGMNDSKTWCQHASEISGANFINIGIGGTRLSSRVPMAHIFDANNTYLVNGYVYYFTSGHYHFYKCTTQHNGEWNANDFTELTNDSRMYVGLDIVNLVTMACDTNTSIESRFADAYAAADCVKTNVTSHDNNTPQVDRLKAVDFSTVDAIVIMAGTNDYANRFGNSDSAIITEENGAINAIVEQLSTAYGTIPIYFIKEPVRWFPLEVEGEKTYPDNYWCDVYSRSVSGVDITLTEYFDKLEEQFNIINHIPVCDLYFGLGWNKQNFWNFYGIQLDGTHPYYGFRIIAEKIVSFIIANKLF